MGKEEWILSPRIRHASRETVLLPAALPKHPVTEHCRLAGRKRLEGLQNLPFLQQKLSSLPCSNIAPQWQQECLLPVWDRESCERVGFPIYGLRPALELVALSALSSPVCVPGALSVYLQSHGADNNLLAQSWGESIILYLVLPVCCSGSSHLVSILRPHSSGLRGRPTGPDGSYLVLMPPPSFGGGGSRGGPVGSFARMSLSHSSLQRHAPRHAPVPKSMQLVHSILSVSI